jgi:putative colanic acid biosysnthesis UDP-glucose lipid carrier transferase
MAKLQNAYTASAFNKNNEQSSLGKDNFLSLCEAALCAVTSITTLWAIAFYMEGEISSPYFILSILVFALTFPGQTRLEAPPLVVITDLLTNWIWIVALLATTGYATGYAKEFDADALKLWIIIAPLVQVTAHLLLKISAPYLLKMQGPMQRAVIVGINPQGIALAAKMQASRFSRVELIGFIDSRAEPRQPEPITYNTLGKISELAELVKSQRIQLIYLSLPMASQPRILQILDDLKDTTASIYFVPDMFVTDIIQGHHGTVCGMPVIAVCDTPFKGVDGVIKRGSDIVFSTLILTLIAPILLFIAIAVKLSSPGPVIFKQRRYGLDGEEILVYKFRSMTVTDDGAVVQQAKKNDSRITPLGAFLRKTSLDELPQFLNVLQGRMSIVGPRPHAVAHNELYRKLIKGYMVRHKVKPGITGWAQVNGYRGETETLDKMQGRIDYDLDYLRNWSLRLDVHIILKTVKLVFNDRKAY